jgi:hypothetical protein
MIIGLDPGTHGAIAALKDGEVVLLEPGNGSVSMFRFGQACGAIGATLAVMGIPTTFVLPRSWQQYHGIGPTPDAARQRAAQLYPQIAPRLSRKADGNRADALLIAAYGQRALAKPSNVTHLAGHHHLRREDVEAASG